MTDQYCGRVHWVTAELDAHGEIDRHAALCLRHAIDQARASAVGLVVVDLRDLTAIGAAGLALLRAHDADCRAHGTSLGLLISARDHGLAEAFALAGLSAMLHHLDEPPLPVRRDGGGLRLRARAGIAQYAALAARLAPRGGPPSRTV